MQDRTIRYKDKLIFWLIGVTALCVFVYSVSSILLPFVVAMIAAYFLNPAAAKIEHAGLSRSVATTLITCSFFILVVTITVLLAPILYNQLLTFIHTVPTYVTFINEKMLPEFSSLLSSIDPEALQNAKGSVSNVSGYALKFLGSLASNIWSSGIAVLNLFSLLFITPIVTFYMLRDWNNIVKNIDSWLPPKYAATP